MRHSSRDTDCIYVSVTYFMSTSGGQHAAATAEGRIHKTTKQIQPLLKGKSKGQCLDLLRSSSCAQNKPTCRGQKHVELLKVIIIMCVLNVKRRCINKLTP